MRNLIAKTALGFLFLIGALASILTVSAGSTSFWQAWVYLGVFASCTILITAYLVRNDRELLASRVKVGPVAETRPSQKVIQGFAKRSSSRSLSTTMTISAMAHGMATHDPSAKGVKRIRIDAPAYMG